MAQEIVTGQPFGPMTSAVMSFSLPDLAATSSAQDAGAPMGKWRAAVYVKAFTSGSGTVGPIFAIEVADNSAMTTNLRTVAVGQTQRLDEQELILEGGGLKAPQQFGRVKLTLSGTDTGTFDAILQAA